MKSILNRFVVIPVCLLFVVSFPAHLFGGYPEYYRGKIVLVVDQSLTQNSQVSANINRLVDDLTGDGWRVLRHDVERGPGIPTTGIQTDFDNWAQANARRIREARSLIKADYDAAPGEVKAVFLVGHVPVPYSGTSQEIDGGHYSGAH